MTLARRMRDDDREDLAEHSRQLADLQHDVGELRGDVADLRTTVNRIEYAQREHGALLRAIVDKLGIDPARRDEEVGR